MSRDWSTVLRQWAKPPSEAEEEKGERAARMIREAVRASTALNARNVHVYATGSYRNNTNVRLQSDVDVAVVLKGTVFHNSPAGVSFTPATCSFDTFRSEVEQALRAKFGVGFSAGDKAFNIHENGGRLDADVAVFFEYREYTGRLNVNGSHHFHEGVRMVPRRGGAGITNWHVQHYERGVAKNQATGRRFKRVVRILKRLRTEMNERGTAAQQQVAVPIASFLVECLVYNVPIATFNPTSQDYLADTRAVIGWLWHKLNKGEHAGFKEVSEMKLLFGAGQSWTPGQAAKFLLAAWNFDKLGAG